MFVTAEKAEKSVSQVISSIIKDYSQYFLAICGVAVTAAFSNIILGVLCSKWVLGAVTAFIVARAIRE